jgi:hypothetical protein
MCLDPAVRGVRRFEFARRALACIAVLLSHACFPGPCHNLGVADELVFRVDAPTRIPIDQPPCDPALFGFAVNQQLRMAVTKIPPPSGELVPECLPVCADLRADTGWSYQFGCAGGSFSVVAGATKGGCRGALSISLGEPGDNIGPFMGTIGPDPVLVELMYRYVAVQGEEPDCPTTCNGGLLGMLHVERAAK